MPEELECHECGFNKFHNLTHDYYGQMYRFECGFCGATLTVPEYIEEE
jgi:transcription elongation factor Elf1